jgi:gamma-glutamylcyclotransferase (GGCT)/AIG2-like uncharacterized protein YtfP
MHDVLTHQARYADAGWVRGRLYQLDGYPGYVPTTGLTDWVRGDVYAVPNASVLLGYLDVYEEVTTEERTSEYLRRRRLVRLGGGCWRTAWTYVYNRPVNPVALIQSGDWLSTIRS